MSKFIKLSTLTINTKYIIGISSTPIKHQITFNTHNYNGRLFPIGPFDEGDTIEVCIRKHPNDYKIISEWIKNL